MRRNWWTNQWRHVIGLPSAGPFHLFKLLAAKLLRECGMEPALGMRVRLLTDVHGQRQHRRAAPAFHRDLRRAQQQQVAQFRQRGMLLARQPAGPTQSEAPTITALDICDAVTMTARRSVAAVFEGAEARPVLAPPVRPSPAVKTEEGQRRALSHARVGRWSRHCAQLLGTTQAVRVRNLRVLRVVRAWRALAAARRQAASLLASFATRVAHGAHAMLVICPHLRR